MPRGCDGLWDSFLLMHGGRGAGMAGPDPIGPAGLLAWQQLHDVQFTPWEIDTLLALDRVALRAAAQALPPDQPSLPDAPKDPA